MIGVHRTIEKAVRLPTPSGKNSTMLRPEAESVSMVDLRLAEMVEQAEARNEIACAASRAKIKGVKAEVIPFSSGFLVSGTPGVASAVGAGPRGRLSPAEVREMEAFFE